MSKSHSLKKLNPFKKLLSKIKPKFLSKIFLKLKPKTFEQKLQEEQKFQEKLRQFVPNPTPENKTPALNCGYSKTFALYWHYVKPYQFYIFLAIAMIMAGSSIDGYLIYQIKFIVDQGGGILNKSTLTSFSYVLIVLMTIRAFMNFLSQLFFSKSNQGLLVSLGEKVFRKIACMPQSFFDLHGHGAIISKIQYGVTGMTGASGNVLLALSRDGSTVVAFLFVMFGANWMLSSVIFLLLPTIYLALKLVKYTIANLTTTQLASAEVQIQFLNEMVKGHQIVSLYNAQKFEHKRYFEAVDGVRIAGEKGIMATNFGHCFIQFIASLLLAAIILLSAYAKDLHIPPISPGDFIVIFTSMFGLLKPIRNLTNVFSGFIGSLQAAKQILGLLALKEEENNGTKTEKDVDFSKDIEYKNVSFSYPTRPDKLVLKNFSLNIKAGQTYALVGKSGGGKSTIISLLPRIYEINKEVKESSNLKDIEIINTTSSEKTHIKNSDLNKAELTKEKTNQLELNSYSIDTSKDLEKENTRNNLSQTLEVSSDKRTDEINKEKAFVSQQNNFIKVIISKDQEKLLNDSSKYIDEDIENKTFTESKYSKENKANSDIKKINSIKSSFKKSNKTKNLNSKLNNNNNFIKKSKENNLEKSGIFIDGVNIKDIELSVLRNNISVVSQNIHLFDDTIFNNIIYCDIGKYSKEQVLEAARLAHVLDFTKDLKDGIDTLIGSDGTRLSGGQRQRVSIARAILRQKPILILDEATSALDNESEFYIQKSLNELQKGKTVLIIAHRLSTIENADQIVVINDGKIVEQGKHESLIKNTNGEYYKLHSRKFSN